MSEYQPKQRQLEPPLPPELAQCESALAAMSLPPSRIQRDVLLYRAGRAAGEVDAKSSLAAAQRSVSDAGGRTTLAWSLASATLAASLAVVITQGLQPSINGSPGDRVEVIGDDGKGVSTELMPPQTVSTSDSGEYSRRLPVAWRASLLNLRDRALFQQLDDPWVQLQSSLTASSADDGVPSPRKSSREMLREFLPSPAAQDALHSKMKRQLSM